MPLATSKKQKSLPSSNGMAFYIVGTRRLENELMASYLEGQTGDPCVVTKNVNHIPTDNPKTNGRPKLVFWDCKGNNLKSFIAELRAWTLRNQSSLPIVLFNVPSDLEFEKRFVSEGIQGFFYENDPLDVFLKGVRAVIDGRLWLSRDMMTKCIFEGTRKDNSAKSQIENLSQRQIEILALVAVGTKNDEIADKLCISPHTVKTHLYRIFKKINVPNRVQAALWAAQNL
jgi:LuxR family transcriptional regulator, positive regulator of biofilm formation